MIELNGKSFLCRALVARRLFIGIMLFSLLIGPVFAGGEGEEKVTLSLAFWDVRQEPFIDWAVEEFAKTHPHVTIETSLFPFAHYWERMQVAETTGDLPDIFWINRPNFPRFVRNGLLLNLQSRVDADAIDLERYARFVVESYRFNGDLHAFPKDFDVVAVGYNKAHFDEAGLAYPSDDWTWDDFRETAKRLTKREGDRTVQYGALIDAGDAQSSYFNFIYSNGGGIIDEDAGRSLYDSPQTREALQFVHDLIFVDGSAPTANQVLETNYNELFVSGRVSMAPSGSWNARTFYDVIGEDLDYARLPIAPSGGRVGVIHGLGWASSANTEYPDSVWDFIRLLVSEEASEQHAAVGVIPAHEAGVSIWLDSLPNQILQAYVDQSNDVNGFFPASIKFNEWFNVVTERSTDILNDDASVEEATGIVAEKMNEVLATE